MAVSLYEIDFRGKVMWVTYGGDLLECMCSYIESNNYVLQNSLLAFVFKFFIPPSPTLESFDRKQLCSRELEGKEVAQFQEAIEDLYYFEFIYGEQLVCIGVCQLTSACICCAIVSLQLCCYNNNRYHI